MSTNPKLAKRLADIKQQQDNRKSGLLNIIPFYYHFPRLSKYLPGLFKQGIYKILSGTGVGKSKLARQLSVMIPHELSISHGLKFHTIFVSLEESEEEFIDSMIITMLSNKYGIDIDRLTLNSYYENPLTDDVYQKIVSIQNDVNDILQHVTVIDNIRNPTGIYRKCIDIISNYGTHTYKTITIDGNEQKVYDKFIPNDNTFIIIVTDHISLLDEEYSSIKKKTLDKREAMSLWNEDYCMSLANRMDAIILNIQQTTMTADDVNHQKANRLEPDLTDAGDNKTVLRTDKVVIAIHDPTRYGLKKWGNYDLTSSELFKKFRPLKILKNRYGIADISVPLLFNGVTGRFTELDKR